ncbi:hypothetical protein AAF712_008203 [Marasmius tenuissimus]|uniref:Uncharacterized protein n=1 Tax=Marasmius tenuissimus TaxID=585030 RepID=A0ABR2ZT02_9AGAR|nr:hypothetical protein PM082_016234 [Marasmius tenuissimus]
MSSTISLFDHLTGFGSDSEATGPAATELIQRLVKVVGYDACQAKRNTTYIYSVVSDYRDVNKTLNEWIGKLETSSDAAEQLRLFEDYTTAIDKIEEELLKLSLLFEEGNNVESQYDKVGTIDTCIALAQFYRKTRDGLGAAIVAVPSSVTQKPDFSSVKRAPFTDDYAHIVDIQNKIPTLAAALKIKHKLYKELAGHLKRTETSLAKWSSEDSTTDPEIVQAISIATVQFWMLVHFLFDKAHAAGESRDENALWKLLNTRKVWEETLKTATIVNEHLEAPSTADTLETALKEYMKFLKPGLFAQLNLPDILTLRRMAAKIARPYFGQAVALIRECEALIKSWEAKTHDQQTNIEEAFAKSTDALKAAADHRTKDPGNFTVSDEVAQKFTAAHTDAKECFGNASLSNEWEGKMKDAMQMDEQRMEAFKKRVSPHPSQTESKPQKDKVSVSVDIGKASKKYEVEKDTMLSGLLWLCAKQPDGPKLTARAHFIAKGDAERKRLASDMLVKESLEVELVNS